MLILSLFFLDQFTCFSGQHIDVYYLHMLVVIYAANWTLLSSKKKLKILPEKKVLYFRKWNFLDPKRI